jgi:hypothetical protein
MDMKSVRIRTATIPRLVILFAIILSATVIAAGPKCRSSDFACFKRKMMPQVGRKITVKGMLAAAKLGWIVTFDHGGIYVYARHESDSDRMKSLDTFKGQSVKVTGTLGYSQGSPSQTPEAASVPEHFFFDIAEVKVISPRAPAEITFREMRLRKPPLAELYFDVVLRNDHSGPRWFLLSSNLGPGTSALLTKGGVDTVEVFAPHGSGHVVVGHFLGTGGFYALLLPAHAEIRLRMFPISYWGEVPDHLQVEVVIAKGLTIGGEPARAWFELNPTCSTRADIVESALSYTRIIGSRHAPDRKEVRALSEEENRFKLDVMLKPDK